MIELAIGLMILVAVLHELAHALVATLVGAKVWGVVIGIGPIVEQGRWRGVNVRVRKYPLIIGIGIEQCNIHTPLQGTLIAIGPTLLSLLLLPVPIFGRLFLIFNLLNLLPLPHSDGKQLWLALTHQGHTA